MSEVAYVSEVRIERIRGPARLAYLPSETAPVHFGVHGAVARHYGVSPEVSEPHAATLDYVVAAAGGWMTGTFGGALEARKVDASGGRLNALARGEVEVDDGVLVIKRIHITFHIRARAADRGTIERVHGFYASKCPVYRSIQAAIAVTSSFELEEEQP